MDVAACYAAIDATSSCAKAARCNDDCIVASCAAACDTAEGSGRTPTSTQYGDCADDVTADGSTGRPKGSCYDKATKDFKACQTDPKFANCNPSDVITFYRGACRDNGNWAHATEPM
jgi:hypothetical protein